MARKKKETFLSPKDMDKALAKHQNILDILDGDAKDQATRRILTDALEAKKAMCKRNNANRSRGKALEKKIAKATGMERVPYSGSSKEFGWGDIKSPHILFESKSITPTNPKQKNLIILKKDVDDIIRQARESNRIPAYAASLRGESQIYVTMTMEDWLMMMSVLKLLDLEAKEIEVKSLNEVKNGQPLLLIDKVPYNEWIRGVRDGSNNSEH